jgi:hypothetical protein
MPINNATFTAIGTQINRSSEQTTSIKITQYFLTYEQLNCIGSVQTIGTVGPNNSRLEFVYSVARLVETIQLLHILGHLGVQLLQLLGAALGMIVEEHVGNVRVLGGSCQIQNNIWVRFGLWPGFMDDKSCIILVR